MKKRFAIFAMLGVAALAVSLPATSRAGEFYEGKSIRFIVGFATGGGGYHAYT
jgi:hypothetical protein